MRKKKTSLTTQYVILMGILLLAANIILGAILVINSYNASKVQMRKRMLSISSVAAGTINGDELASLTKEDENGELFNKIKAQLTVFKNNTDIVYIYAVRHVEGRIYEFTVDADPEKPARFGQRLVDTSVTYALTEASKGHAAVDYEKYTDEWGTYYSSFSPVYDSNKKICGIIGIDFNSDLYDQQLWQDLGFIIAVSSLFVLFSLIIIFMINRKVKERFKKLDSELLILSSDVDELNDELMSDRGFSESKQCNDFAENNVNGSQNVDEIEEIGTKLHFMHGELKRYIEYSHIKASTDALTRAKNSLAYYEKQNEITSKINTGCADFSIVVFDINYLKHINDIYGHAVGDKVIRASATIISKVFSSENTYRIGGDEFAVITEDISEDELEKKLNELEEEITGYNNTRPAKSYEVSLSYGASTFDSKSDTTYKEVFIRADRIMYDKKTEYHKEHPDR